MHDHAGDKVSFMKETKKCDSNGVWLERIYFILGGVKCTECPDSPLGVGGLLQCNHDFYFYFFIVNLKFW